MMKMTKPENSILTGKPLEDDDFHFSGKLFSFHVGEISKVTVLDSSPSDNVYLRFSDDKGDVFTVAQRKIFILYMATCLTKIDREDVIPPEYKDEKDSNGRFPIILCSDPRVVWLVLVHLWLFHMAPKDLRDDATLSEILTDLIPSYDEAIENLEKNKYPPFVTCRDDLVYASEKYRGEEARERRLNYHSYLEKYGDWLIEPPKVDWDKYRK